MSDHPALAPGRVAVVTGGASGIGLAAALKFATRGLRVCIADLEGDRLAAAHDALIAAAPGGKADVLACPADVADITEVRKLAKVVGERFGDVGILMNNAGIQPGSGMFRDLANWRRILDVNLFGVINAIHVFGAGMMAQQSTSLIINTGSKQGITTPPGDPAYNTSKAALKVVTEALAHELRNTPGNKVTAHLFIPGFVFTALTAAGRTEKPAAAWTPEQTVDFMLDSVARGDFYIVCPDNEATRALDERRILWAAGDIVENRPALSRWHPDHADAFRRFIEDDAVDG